MIKYMTSNNRPKTYYAKLTRSGTNNWTVERVNRLDVSNQYSQKIARDNKREFTSALKQAADAGTLNVL